MLNAARINIEAAEMEDIIEVKNRISLNLKKDMFPLLMVFNPPYMMKELRLTNPIFTKKLAILLNKNIQILYLDDFF